MQPRIRLDASLSVVALCSCGWRAPVAATRPEAWAAGSAHVRAAHPEDVTAAAAAKKRRQRGLEAAARTGAHR